MILQHRETICMRNICHSL